MWVTGSWIEEGTMQQILKVKLGASTGCYEGELLTENPYGFNVFVPLCQRHTRYFCFLFFFLYLVCIL